MAETVSRVVLSVSPQLHPFDATDNAPSPIRLVFGYIGSLHVGLPGLNDSVSALAGGGSRLRSLTKRSPCFRRRSLRSVYHPRFRLFGL